MPQVQTLTQLLDGISLPSQTSAQLDFCSPSTPAAVSAWLEQLPILQLDKVGPTLHQALASLLATEMTLTDRLAMLKAFEERLDAVFSALSLRYLNRSLILPDEAKHAATLAQSLQKNLNNGYWICLKQLLIRAVAEPDLRQQANFLSTIGQIAAAIYRGLNQQLLRHLVLYFPIPKPYWQKLHLLFRIVTALDNGQRPELTQAINGYKKALLLGASHLNQLRQQDILQCFDVIDRLTPTIRLAPFDAANRSALFAVNIQGESPPQHKTRLNRDEVRANLPAIYDLNTHAALPILAELEAQHSLNAQESRTGKTPSLNIPLSLPAVQHLQKMLSHLSLRGFERETRAQTIEITLGLTDLHFYLTNETPFDEFLNLSQQVKRTDNSASPFTSRLATSRSQTTTNKDAWDNAFSIEGTTLAGEKRSTDNIEMALNKQSRANYQQQHNRYNIEIIDASLGGYGLEWKHAIPAQLKAGEVVGLKEAGHTTWSVGVIRWVHQIKGGAQFGVQLLSPLAQPVALAGIQKTGNNNEFLRAIKLPALRAANQPETLITNAISFYETLKARLYEGNKQERNIQLSQRLFHTGAINQFAFKELYTDSPQELSLTPFR